MGDLKPHRIRYWLNPNIKSKEEFIQEVKEVCNIYKKAQEYCERGIHVVSIDEMTGIQALEHVHPVLPMKEGKVERMEFEYKRHGTTTLIANFEIATGSIIEPFINKTRTEYDFAKNISRLVSTFPDDEWIFITDQLNTHQSESLVRYIASHCKIDVDLGKKGKTGILKSIDARKIFLTEKSHKIRFVYTPKHTSWLNQVEIWFSIIKRKLLNRRSSFRSVKELESKILKFIDYYNLTSNPFKWTYNGMLLEK